MNHYFEYTHPTPTLDLVAPHLLCMNTLHVITRSGTDTSFSSSRTFIGPVNMGNRICWACGQVHRADYACPAFVSLPMEAPPYDGAGTCHLSRHEFSCSCRRNEYFDAWRTQPLTLARQANRCAHRAASMTFTASGRALTLGSGAPLLITFMEWANGRCSDDRARRRHPS